MMVVFLAPPLSTAVFLSQPGRGVHLFCIFLSCYFSVSFQYNFFSFTYKIYIYIYIWARLCLYSYL